MTPPAAARHPLRDAWRRLVDGDRVWGTYDVWPDRFGMINHRLLVYPPGISAPERRRLRLWRGWPAWGGLLWVMCEMALVPLLSPWPALGVSTTALLGTGVAAARRAGRVRTQVRSVIVTAGSGYGHPAARRDAARVGRLAAALADADTARRHGALSAVEFEATWWWVYRALGARDSGARSATP